MCRCLIAFLPIFLTGCVAPSTYQWGAYERDLYTAYKDPTQYETFRLKLEALTTEVESRREKVAPGIYAELGTLYLQKGDANTAIAMYKKERDTWPESKGLMTAMIQNLEKRENSKQEPQK